MGPQMTEKPNLVHCVVLVNVTEIDADSISSLYLKIKEAVKDISNATVELTILPPPPKP